MANERSTFLPENIKNRLTASLGLNYINLLGFYSIKLEEYAMSVLIRRFKLPTGMMKEERIDDPDRIERYMQFFDREEQAKLEAGQKVFLDKDEWQFVDN